MPGETGLSIQSLEPQSTASHLELQYKRLHAKFSTFLKLMELVSAINNNGHQTLQLPYTPTHYSHMPGSIDKVVFALATILMCNHEVITVVLSDPSVKSK